MSDEIVIQTMREDDQPALLDSFRAWGKHRFLFQLFWQDQERGGRVVLVAWHADRAVGYTNLVWKPRYPHFRAQGIPEIVDLNVMTAYQRRGIGTALIRECESRAQARGLAAIGISVEQSPQYAVANRLYPRLGYVPDGQGISPHDNELHLLKALS